MTAADYENHRISFEGECGSKGHNLELHDVLNKTYIHVKHESEKRRYEKKDLFGFRACNDFTQTHGIPVDRDWSAAFRTVKSYSLIRSAITSILTCVDSQCGTALSAESSAAQLS